MYRPRGGRWLSSRPLAPWLCVRNTATCARGSMSQPGPLGCPASLRVQGPPNAELPGASETVPCTVSLFRMALGARPADVLRLVVRQGLSLVFAGLMVGLGLSLAASRSIAAISIF